MYPLPGEAEFRVCFGFREGVPGLLSNQGEKKYKLVFHNGSFKKKVLKYGTPKPRYSRI